ncbi:hypothetical protein [Ruminococcus flavefaciens]|uniref:Lipocalin-like domain-containing protein n=1 Tax=Ruminococcus flavefaciens TaxID=1265 RepID=A0A1K1MV79_RUMFL|nr:hypothetical protein [Ruminococcus flavefaciens]SFW26909.1 hypothetical protein SAMN02910280_1398 [Ruminococcus flavefaciens]
MKKIICFCLSAFLLAGTFCGCSDKKPRGSAKESATESATAEATTNNEPVDNEGKQFLGKWESYKALVMDVEYETEYAGYPLSAVAKLEVNDDKTATMIVALNPHGKENTFNFSWNITNIDGDDVLHLASPTDFYDCTIKQGQMLMRYGDYDDGTIIYLMKTNKFTEIERPTEPGLDKADFSGFMGRWEAEEVTSDGTVYTDKLGEYPINAAFRLEVFEDNNAVMSIIGENSSYEWEPDKKDQLYMWRDYEGFTMKITDGKLYLDNENGLKIRLKKVEKFSEYDFNVTPEDIPEEDIILNPEEETETTT